MEVTKRFSQLSQAKQMEAIKDVCSGKAVSKVAESFGIMRRTLSQALSRLRKKYGLEIPSERPLRENLTGLAEKLVEAGITSQKGE